MINIIVATDFTPLAENAVHYAAAIAKHYQTKLVLFSVFKLSTHASNSLLPASAIQEMLNEHMQKLRKKADLIAFTYDIKVAYETTFSFIEEELQKILVKYDAKLLVLGMASKSLEQDLLGNTTTAAIKKLKFPVLAVPEGAKFEGLKRILFACDVLHDVPEKILLQIKELAAPQQSEVEIFYVDEKIEALKAEGKGLISLDMVNDGLDGVTYSHKNVRSNTVIKEIEKEIKSFQAQLLIMIPKEYGFWASLVHKSKTRMMASGLDIPLLSIPI